MFSTVQRVPTQLPADQLDRFLSERQFAVRLSLERKRAERSGHVFMLALVRLPKTDLAERRVVRDLILPALCPAVRDTDALGWYDEDSVVGLIFTHLHDASRAAAKTTLDAKLGGALSAAVPVQTLQHVHVSYHFFPEDNAGSPAGDGVVDPGKGVGRTRRSARIMKRTIDIGGSATLLLLLSPLFVIIAVLIKLGSKGPVFFRQTRLGQYGRTFTFLKFRSMYVNNDPTIHREYVTQLIAGQDVAHSNGAQHKVFKIVDDPRVTRFGRILRKSSLDELPQFFNVFKGEMSLVGPRPPVPYEFQCYEVWHRRRVMEVKPGISGLWQVNGRSKTTFDEMVRLDLQYARNWSIWLDLKILLRTPAAVISGDGAY